MKIFKKKSIFLFLAFFLSIGHSVAQIAVPDLSDLKKPVIDLDKLKEAVTEDFDNYDYANDMIVIGTVCIYPDEASEKIIKEVKEKEYILYFKQKNEFYAFNPDTAEVDDIFYKINDDAILMKPEGALFNVFVKGKIGPVDYPIYLIRLFERRSYYLSMFYVNTGKHQEFISIFFSHPSLERIFDYYFGSPENYIETYRKREYINSNKTILFGG